jgi:superfamily II DNA or RNA helicase/HKD family nuclease
MTIDLNDLDPFGQDVGFGYLDRSVHSPLQYQPQLILNTKSDSMLRALRRELKYATSFTFSVAFVSPRAIALLKQELVDFEGVGRIITSDYLGFNSPNAFAELLNLSHIGIDVRLHNDSAFHPKGYVFGRPESVTAILGSSNLTESALAQNHEWNLKVSLKRESNLADQFTNLLDEELFESSPLTQEWIDAYAITYTPPSRPNRRTTVIADFPNGNEVVITDTILPNSMQIDALVSIGRVRAAGKNRALIISATGTGKTILSALDVRTVNPDRMLFVAHREQILDRAMREFRKVLGGPSSDFGKLAGATRDGDRRYVFATVQTLSQPHVLQEIDPSAFDYILIDEVHRAGAASFRRVLDHFKPKFLLGMTATPERGDGENVFEIFDFNVPYEIRLSDALELDMLAPFHYYGVADFTFENGLVTSETTELKYLVATERVEHVIRALETYGQAGVRPRGLIFCSRKDEAYELSERLNERHLHGKQLRTVALTGDDSIDTRERRVEQLEGGDLDYLVTVDVFNEGVDIPTINQVVMLRQTQSSIVFVQQLGRGLRKSPGKEYLVVIDFIGNYANNYLIPIALFGDDSLNKESLRKNLIAAEEIGVIAGLSSVRFDRIAQDRVLQSLAQSKLDSLPNLKSAIETIRNRVGRVPKLFDFLRFESVDPVVLATKLDTYPALLAKVKIAESDLSDYGWKALAVVSKELLTAKRANELTLVQSLLRDGPLSQDSVVTTFEAAGIASDEFTVSSTIRSLTMEFNTASELQSLGLEGLAELDSEGRLQLTKPFTETYAGSTAFRAHVDDVVDTGLALIESRYRPDRPFTPGRQYSRKDASRLLNWSSNMYSTIYGYRVDAATGTCPIFVTLHKSGEVSASTAYEDSLVDTNSMTWYSKSKRTITSSDTRPIVENTVELHVFAKKDDAEGSDFYYLGLATSADAVDTTMAGQDGNELSVVRMKLRFAEPIQAALFDYFHTEVVDGV